MNEKMLGRDSFFTGSAGSVGKSDEGGSAAADVQNIKCKGDRRGAGNSAFGLFMTRRKGVGELAVINTSIKLH